MDLPKWAKISTLLGILDKLCDFLQIVLFWILQHLWMGIYLLPCVILFLFFYLHGNYLINQMRHLRHFRESKINFISIPNKYLQQGKLFPWIFYRIVGMLSWKKKNTIQQNKILISFSNNNINDFNYKTTTKMKYHKILRLFRKELQLLWICLHYKLFGQDI